MADKNLQLTRKALNVLMVLSVFSGTVQIAVYTAIQIHWEFDSISLAVMYGSIIAAIDTGLVMLVVRDQHGCIHEARITSRILVALLIFAFGFDVMFIPSTPLSTVFIVQFLLVIAYQMRNDPNLDRHDPQEGGFCGAIPLSFFNLFWIFVICSFVGLVGETVVSFFRDGRWESRAGFVFGPLSPIYGVGGVLITAALNRLYEKEPWLQFLIAGAVGAAFEYFAGWFWESAFGIVAWSYEGQIGNLGGHTSVFMACVWGACGILWIRAVLPHTMRLIDRIPLRARVPATLLLTIVLLADAILTVICLDCWYMRTSGLPVVTPWQKFCAQYFGDEFMQQRFETMSMWTSLAKR